MTMIDTAATIYVAEAVAGWVVGGIALVLIIISGCVLLYLRWRKAKK